MYNRYIPGRSGYDRVRVEDDVPPAGQARPSEGPPEPEGARSPGDEAGKQSAGVLSSLLKTLKLERLDTGDILLLLILLFLFLEGDDLELVITLALLLLLGLD